MRTFFRTSCIALSLAALVGCAADGEQASAQQQTAAQQAAYVAPYAASGDSALINRQEGDYIVRNHKFRSGETLPEIRLHFTTAGTQIRDAAGKIRNAVVVMHGSSSNSSQVRAASFITPLVGAGQPLDLTKHFLIFPDVFGVPPSTAPSDGLRAKFPKYGYHDMVDLEHRLITEHFGIERLRAVVGISMGGMHTWLWGERYPNMMDALVPLSSLPSKIDGRNLLWRRILVNAIRNDPTWNDGNYTEPPKGFLNIMPMFDMLVQSPARMAERIQTYEAADEAVEEAMEEALEEDDANNILYRFGASFDFDPGPDLPKITAPLLAILFEDDELNPPELGVIEREIKRIPKGQFVRIPSGPQSQGHRGQVQAQLWREHLAKFMSALPPLPVSSSTSR
jgi:homoserine O-acetyltransferase